MLWCYNTTFFLPMISKILPYSQRISPFLPLSHFLNQISLHDISSFKSLLKSTTMSTSLPLWFTFSRPLYLCTFPLSKVIAQTNYNIIQVSLISLILSLTDPYCLILEAGGHRLVAIKTTLEAESREASVMMSNNDSQSE